MSKLRGKFSWPSQKTGTLTWRKFKKANVKILLRNLLPMQAIQQGTCLMFMPYGLAIYRYSLVDRTVEESFRPF